MNASQQRLETMKPGERATLTKAAHNAATQSENKIHDDAEARRLGLRGGLVPGVTLYAYLTELLLPLLGPAWLRHGSTSVRFIRPVYEGETVTCAATLVSRSGDAQIGEATLELGVTGPDGAPCVTGSANLRWGESADQLEDAGSKASNEHHGRTEGPEPPQRRPLTRTTAPIGQPLNSLTLTVDADAAAAYADETSDSTPWYRSGSPFGLPLVPPGLLAGQPARLLRHNFEFGPSVHAASEVQHLALPLAGGEYRVDGVILETFEKRGNDYLVAVVRIRDHAGSPVMRIRHTSIFRFSPRA